MKDRDGCTPLYCAAAWNQVEAVRQLDRLGCPSWQKSLEGRTPVHVAAEQGWVDLIDLLVRELKNKVSPPLLFPVLWVTPISSPQPLILPINDSAVRCSRNSCPSSSSLRGGEENEING